MRYSIHLDECVRSIEKKPEHTTDLLLVELVKISHLGEKIGQAVLLVQSDSEIQVPTALKLGSFQMELDILKKGVPSALGDDGTCFNSFFFYKLKSFFFSWSSTLIKWLS